MLASQTTAPGVWKQGPQCGSHGSGEGLSDLEWGFSVAFAEFHSAKTFDRASVKEGKKAILGAEDWRPRARGPRQVGCLLLQLLGGLAVGPGHTLVLSTMWFTYLIL